MRSQLFLATAVSAGALIAERQEGACQSALIQAQALITGIPPPPANTAFVEFLAGQTGIATQTADCAIPTVTGEPSLVSEYNGWISSLTSWLGENGPQVQSVFSACSADPVFSQVVDGLNLPVDAATLCSSYTFATGTAGSGAASNGTATGGAATPTSTSDDSDSGSESGSASATSTDAPAAAARQTGMAMAAVAVAGLAALL